MSSFLLPTFLPFFSLPAPRFLVLLLLLLLSSPSLPLPLAIQVQTSVNTVLRTQNFSSTGFCTSPVVEKPESGLGSSMKTR